MTITERRKITPPLSQFEQTCTDWLDTVGKASTRSVYSYALKNLLLWMRDNHYEEPSMDIFHQFEQFLEANKKPQTASVYIMAVRRLARWLQDTQGYTGLIREKAKTFKNIDPAPKKEFTHDDRIALLKSISCKEEINLRDFCILLLIFSTPIKLRDIFEIEVGDLIFMHGKVMISYPGLNERGKFSLEILHPVLAEAIQHYLFLRRQNRDTRRSDPLFLNGHSSTTGLPINRNHLRSRTRDRLDSLNMDGRIITTSIFRKERIEKEPLTAEEIDQLGRREF